MTIYIGNLSYRVAKRELEDLLGQYGRVVSCALPIDRETGRPRGFAFVSLSSLEEELEAIRELDGQFFMDRRLRVNLDRKAAPDQPRRRHEHHDPDQLSNISDLVPMEYRAQVKGRCQRQFVAKRRRGGDTWLDSQIFVKEWLSAAHPSHPYSHQTHASKADAKHLTHGLQVEIPIGWRLISNSGIDDGFIRPVIGPGGWPLIPGSSIKGLFRRACSNPHDSQRWCGAVKTYKKSVKETLPGILRFHGAWPKDANWKEAILDVTHPQEHWQVGFNSGGEKHNAIAVISLFKPTLIIAISSTIGLSKDEWGRIENTLIRALERGVGGRTASGYGLPATSLDLASQSSKPVFLSVGLRGQGPASKLLDFSTEFRPTLFRGTIRSMALRLFGGLTSANGAESAVKDLFGGFGSRGSTLGLLACEFIQQANPTFEEYGNTWRCYCEGDLIWRLTSSARHLSNQKIKQLRDLLSFLHGLVMALGGFGPGWRRPDHSLFMPSYKTRQIGCHWQWEKPELFAEFIPTDAHTLKTLIDGARQSAASWLDIKPEHLNSSFAPWREVIHPQKMIVWCRNVCKRSDAVAIKWTHQPSKQQIEHPPQGSLARSHRKPTDFRGTDLGGLSWVRSTNPDNGRSGNWSIKVGRVWIRMLPIPGKDDDKDLQHSSITQFPSEGPFLEVLTCFPLLSSQSASSTHQQFVKAMEAGANCAFERVWGEIRP